MRSQTSDEEKAPPYLDKQEEDTRQQHFYERSNFLTVPEPSEVPLTELFDFWDSKSVEMWQILNFVEKSLNEKYRDKCKN